MAATHSDVSPRVRPVREVITDVGGALALGAVLLPVAGIVVRWISFLVAQTVNNPVALALAAPPAELVATGLVSLLFGFLVLPAIPYLGYLGIQHHLDKSRQLDKQYEALSPKITAVTEQLELAKAAPEVPKELMDQVETVSSEVKGLTDEYERLGKQHPKGPPALPRVFEPTLNAMYRHKKLVDGIKNTLGAIYWVGLILLGPWPITLATVGIVLALLAVPRIARRTGRAALSQVWPVVVAVLLIAAVGAGFEGTYIVGAVPGDYHFTKDAQLVDGRYVRLGEASGQTILTACGQPGHSVTAVADSQIITVGVEPWKDRSLAWQNLFGILMGHTPAYGFQSPC